MELTEALRTRRAVRAFTTEPVETNVIQELIDTAVLAPSAINLQPWGFAVVQGVERLHTLEAEARRHAIEHLPKDSPLYAHVSDPSFDIFHGAVALIIVCAIDGKAQSSEDCCLAALHLMLAAHAKGLGTCWVGLSRPWLNEAEVKAGLGIPVDWHPVAPVILGRRRALPPPTPRKAPVVVWCP